MKSTKINIFIILKLVLICAISVFFAFVFQYYINLQISSQQMSKDLQIAVFLKDKIENKEVVSSVMKEFTYFDIVDFIDTDKSYEKALELNPELADVVPENTISYPSYFLVNNVSASNMQQLENIKTELIGNDFVSDVVYDAKAFQIFFDDIALILTYKKIALINSILILVLFIIKLILFILKKHFKDIAVELIYGSLASLTAYIIICVLAAITYNPICVLDWHILLVLIPLGAVISFLTKESNA